MHGNTHKHELHTIKLHGKTVQVLYPVYKEPIENSKKPNILTK